MRNNEVVRILESIRWRGLLSLLRSGCGAVIRHPDTGEIIVRLAPIRRSWRPDEHEIREYVEREVAKWVHSRSKGGAHA